MNDHIAAPGQALILALASEIPGFTSGDSSKSWADLGLDSFGLLSLRAAIEEALGRELPDSDWVEASTPDDLASLTTRFPGGGRHVRESGLRLTETAELGMPQMAMGGLSESWLTKTLGDLHWRLIAGAMGAKTHSITDGLGRRLYPTFTRVRFAANAPLAAFEEGEILRFTAALSNFGSGFFFSSLSARSESGRAVDAELMSTFSHRSPAAEMPAWSAASRSSRTFSGRPRSKPCRNSASSTRIAAATAPPSARSWPGPTTKSCRSTTSTE